MKNKLKILNIVTSNTGGAGNAVLRISKTINEFSDSKIIALKGKKSNDSIIIPNFKPYFFLIKAIRFLRHFYYSRLSKKFNKKYSFYNYGEQYNYISPLKLIKYFPFNPDIIIVHFISHFINFKTIYELQKLTGCKVLFNVLDTSFMTGGCHWSWDCTGYISGCSGCPAIKSSYNRRLSKDNLDQKISFIEKIDYSVNVSSTFAYDQVLSCKLFKSKKPSKIYYPIDQNIFKPDNFKCSSIKKIIFFGTQDHKNLNKGIIYFEKALDELSNLLLENEKNNIEIRIAGKNNKLRIPFGFDVIYLGKLSIDKLINEYINTDVFVSSSVEDNGPMMINEALMCGSPVVCFDTGIGPDLINNLTGYLAKNFSSQDLAKGIYKVLFKSDLKKLKKGARHFAVKKYGNKIIKKNWETLVRNI